MIVVFGSINVDIVMRVARHPRPGETVPAEECLVRAGGKGANQAVAAARAGASVAMFAAVGDDAFGRQMRDNLTANGVEQSGVAAVPVTTGCATITVEAGGENVICVAPGANALLRADAVPDAMLGPQTTLITQMEVLAAENWALLARARRVGARTILNYAPALPPGDAALAALGDSVDILVVNETEATLLAGDTGPPEDLAASLAARFGLTAVLTLGADGACAAVERQVLRASSIPVAVVDTTGAGDTFTGVLAAALDRGSALPDALREACAAGSLACRRIGAQEAMPTEAEIAAALGGRRA